MRVDHGGVTYSLRDSLAIVEDLGVPVQADSRVGRRGRRIPFWRQMQADVLGKTVVRMAADEGPAYGVALLAAVGAGEYKNVVEACAATVKTTSETKPAVARAEAVRQGVSGLSAALSVTER